MKAISPVLPSSPDVPEVVFAKDQPQYLQLPACHVLRDHGGDLWRSVVSRYRLAWRERLRVLFFGDLWLEQVTFGNALQPQRPSVFEPDGGVGTGGEP
jgi:hypothetical protein